MKSSPHMQRMAGPRMMGPRMMGPRMAGLAVASAVWFAPLAFAQASDAPGLAPQAIPLENGISLRINVDLVFQPAFGTELKLMQNSFAAGATGPNATSDYVFELLNRTALSGLNEALAQGAKSGRVRVVASGCQVGVAGSSLQAVAQMGVFINTTHMDVENGVAKFRKRVNFIPDTAIAPSPPVIDQDPALDPERVSPKF